MDRRYILDKIRYWESQLHKVRDTGYSSHYQDQPTYRRRNNYPKYERKQYGRY